MPRLLKPVAGRLTQSFGANAAWYRANVGQNGHNGRDYGAPTGTPVKAAADGVIAFEGWGQTHSWMGYPAGISIIIRHSGLRIHTGYAHLSRTIINNGQSVKRGQVIGYVGSTGLASGPHLHFEVLPLKPNWQNGFAGRINPHPYLIAQAKWAVTTGKANVRKSPRLNAPLAGSRRLNKGVRFQYTSVVRGDSVSGNNKWIKSAKGNYVWSGNVKT